jgi:hypothetical protein
MKTSHARKYNNAEYWIELSEYIDDIDGNSQSVSTIIFWKNRKHGHEDNVNLWKTPSP